MTDHIANIQGSFFIGVGPEKTGTTWIDRVLRKHPDVWLPPVKEMRYFWENEHFPQENFFQRMDVKASWHREQYADYMAGRFRSFLNRPRSTLQEFDRVKWDLRYLFTTHDDSWYLSSFNSANSQIRGEISPQYFFLPDSQVQHIRALLPQAKIVISLRRPADWIWSFAKMIEKSGHLQAKFGTFENFVASRHAHGSYSKALKKWLATFGNDQTLVLFYDQLCSDPTAYHERICDFLCIDASFNNAENMAQRVNAGGSSQIPEEYERLVQEMWRDDMQALAKIAPEMPIAWLT